MQDDKQQAPEKFLTSTEVGKIFGCSRNTIHQRVLRKQFPEPLRNANGYPLGWTISYLNDWQQKIIADAKAKWAA